MPDEYGDGPPEEALPLGAEPMSTATGPAASVADRPPSRAMTRRLARRRRRRLVAAVGAVVALTVAGAGIAVARTSEAAPTYRTALAANGSVEQVENSVGTVSAVNRADAAFAVGGTVSAVNVAVGDTVTAGQSLATMDPADLQAALDSANAQLAKDQQQLATDQASQTADTSDSTSSTTSGSSGGPAAARGPGLRPGRPAVPAVRVPRVRVRRVRVRVRRARDPRPAPLGPGLLVLRVREPHLVRGRRPLPPLPVRRLPLAVGRARAVPRHREAATCRRWSPPCRPRSRPSSLSSRRSIRC